MRILRKIAITALLTFGSVALAVLAVKWTFYFMTDETIVGRFLQTGTKDVYLVGFIEDGETQVEALVVQDVKTFPPYYDTRARDRFLSVIPNERACIRVIGLRWGWMSWSRNILEVRKPEACKQ